jgi:hypothetical protein
MGRKINSSMIITALIAACSLSQADVLTKQEIENQVTEVISNPIKVYKLDMNENNRCFERIDTWFSQYINFKEAQIKQNRQADHIEYEQYLSKNIPIPAAREKIAGVAARELFTVTYIKEPQRRSFVKAIDVPTKQNLPDKDVIEAGTNFIITNDFCKITDMDTLSEPLVVSRKRHELKSDIQESDKWTIIQRVIFTRKLSGINVLNSKQIVDIHPDSREILAYKNFMWTPVDESSGKHMAYFSPEQILAQIDTAFAEFKDAYEVENIKLYLYQTDKFIFPVLAVYTSQESEVSETLPQEMVILINLVKDLGWPEDTRAIKYPVEAGK